MSDEIRSNVLVVIDDSDTTRMVLEVLATKGIAGLVSRGMDEAKKRLGARSWDLVLVDLDPDLDDALEFLRTARRNHPELPTVAISETDSAELTIRTVRAGSQDFLVKPVSKRRFKDVLRSFVSNHRVSLAASDRRDARCLYQIAGKSQKFLGLLDLARSVAPSSLPVLITGESGTGKELLSYYVHRESRRREGPYIRVNCAALSESLLESELFGHERGAFTGAYTQRKGRFELAHGGTLLLDEISETGPRLQAELLRVLEQQDFERVGGSEPVRVNVRVISTSNIDLPKAVRCGDFRRDLYFRICGMHLHIPPLRERREDIGILVWHFVNLYAKEVRRRITKLDEEMMQLFRRYEWSGNVRHLRSVVRTALILGEGETLSLSGAPHLLKELRDPSHQIPELIPNNVSEEHVRKASLQLQDLERQAIFEALKRTNSHQARAAELLGITDRTLREKLRRYRQEGELRPNGETICSRQTV